MGRDFGNLVTFRNLLSLVSCLLPEPYKISQVLVSLSLEWNVIVQKKLLHKRDPDKKEEKMMQ